LCGIRRTIHHKIIIFNILPVLKHLPAKILLALAARLRIIANRNNNDYQ